MRHVYQLLFTSLFLRPILIFITSVSGLLHAQQWIPAMQGVNEYQYYGGPQTFHIKFKEGLMGKDWIYGQYLDEDSLTRHVAYREGGKWVPLPFHGYYGNFATDIEMYGDTLYIAGVFRNVVSDKDSSLLSMRTGLIKYFNDSLWAAPPYMYWPEDMAVKGDSILFWTWFYGNGSDTIFSQVMSPDRGKSWRYSYDIIHPTETIPDFGPVAKLEIAPNGDIITLNHDNGGEGRPFYGLARWDGAQWNHYGGISGTGYVKALDFEFFRGELYMGGTFGKYNTWNGDTTSVFPQNPGNSVARWDGHRWHELAGGILEGGVQKMFVHNDALYCFTFAGNWDYHLFGDAQIPFLAAWDGYQWCGTPVNYPVDIAPSNVGFVNDTLFGVFFEKDTLNGQPFSYLNYFDGDYVNGPNAICSTLGLGEEEEEPAQSSFELYPNPTSANITVRLLKDESIQHVQIVDATGKTVHNQSFDSPQNTSVSIDICDLLSGIYIINLNNQYHAKLIKN